ncbi:MAG: hypothetical protein IT269_03550, partial [Saprospiraceae bacterium]|nr:hypothetical protein [Saprospiraceae bacterium]
QQQNHAVTDRRFAYFQHTNDLIRNLNFFGSCEVDFYQRIDSQVNNKPVLTNLLLNLRYRASKRLNLNAGYDNRRNIIYYESYKNFIDQLIDDETRQGLRLGANVKIHKTINLGINSSWRFQKSDLNLSKNLNAYLNISRLPGLNAYLSLSANMLQTNYLNSNFYGARLTKPLLHNKCNLESYYRRVDYQYKSFETNIIHQDIGGFDFSWNLTRKLGLYLTWEGTFEQRKPTFNRVNTRLIRRF